MCYKEGLKLLGKYKIKVIASKICKLEKDLTISKIGYPLVLKAYAAIVIHKNQAGLVKTGILNEKELIGSYNGIVKKLKKINAERYEIILQKEVHGQEFIIGAKKDSTFGSVVIFGLGGIYTDFLNKTSIRISPINKNISNDMIKEIANNLGKKAAKDLANILQKVSRLIGKENLQEIDLNPIIVNEKGAHIVDVRILL